MLTLIPQAEFTVRKRDRMLDHQVYQTEAEDLIKRVPNAAKRLQDRDWLEGADEAMLERLTAARSEYAIDLLSLSYSAGADVSSLAAFFPSVLAYFEEYALYSEKLNATPEEMHNPAPHIAIGDDDFTRANRLLCFAILLGHQQLVPRIMSIIDYKNPVRDAMLERIASIYTERPAPLPTECTRHLPYYKTLAIFNAPPLERPERMHEYLEDWYEASRREPYYESHAKGNQYLGYWSWEAAAITAALGIDDRSYRHLEFYPRDMADYCAQAVAGAARTSEPIAPEVRARAGDACPAAGTWESIGIPTERTNYTVGAAMKDLGSPYGLTVWRHLQN